MNHSPCYQLMYMTLLLQEIQWIRLTKSNTCFTKHFKSRIYANLSISQASMWLAPNKAFYFSKENIVKTFFLMHTSLDLNLSPYLLHPKKLHHDLSPTYTHVRAYRLIISRLLYLSTTRPNITFITKHLSQYLTDPTTSHFNASIGTLKYFKCSRVILSQRIFPTIDWIIL